MEEPVTIDRLLLWLSAKGDGSWSQFRSAVEEFHVQEESPDPDASKEDGLGGWVAFDLPIYQQVRLALQRLGHVEFFAKQAESGWRVVPPALALRVDAPDQGVFCGARSPQLISALRTIQDIDVEISHSPGGPSRILLRAASSDALATRARELGFYVQEAASTAILFSLPRAHDPRNWYRQSIPDTPGWRVSRFVAAELRWTEATQGEAATAASGLFRFVMKHQRFYFLRWRGASYRIPVQVGKYAVMRKRRDLLMYEARTRMLTVPAICRPPLLVERALILCSGLLPNLDPASGRLEYQHVPPEVLRAAAQLLHQEVR